MHVDVVRNWRFPELRQTYTDRDTILYGLALGYGADPTDPDQLAFVYEAGLKAVPTMATTLCHPGFWLGDPQTGIDAARVVHGEHQMRFHVPLPPSGTVRGRTVVTDIIDKGPDKGAILVTERKIYNDATGTLIAVIGQVTMCRGDGGFSMSATAPRPMTKAAGTIERGHSDARVDIPTLPQSALLYRLCADRNPLHADPGVAEQAGFDRPILHGLCTYGVAARAVIAACCDNDPDRLAQFSVRFSAPVFPGETIRTEIWQGADGIRFECKVLERDVTVISNGVAGLHALKPGAT